MYSAGPPGDSGPSSLDWFILGDDGSESDPKLALEKISSTPISSLPSMRYWGVTVLQAVEELDAGPVYAFSQFSINPKEGMNKSDMYRSKVTYAAQHAVLAALEMIGNKEEPKEENRVYSVPDGKRFMGCQTRERPLLKASERVGAHVTFLVESVLIDCCRTLTQLKRMPMSSPENSCLQTLNLVFYPNAYRLIRLKINRLFSSTVVV